jgi:DNA-directed RNA polymerase
MQAFNVFLGLKKRDSIEERLQFADEILDDILDSANQPVTGKRWYLQVRIKYSRIFWTLPIIQ